MKPADREAFVREARTAVLSTVGRDGRVHAVPVWFRWDGESFRIITERGSVKHRNVVRVGRATLCIDERDRTFRYITAEGPVRVNDVVSRDERLALHTVYRGPEAAEKVVAQGGHERMVLLVLTPERWIPPK